MTTTTSAPVSEPTIVTTEEAVAAFVEACRAERTRIWPERSAGKAKP